MTLYSLACVQGTDCIGCPVSTCSGEKFPVFQAILNAVHRSGREESVCLRVFACVFACVRACVCVRVCACVCVCARV